MKRLVAGVLILTLASVETLDAQVMKEWVDTKSPGDVSKIALGYPVPIPVDTPLPFDGFRSYAGLHMRHQDLAASTDYVHPENIGTTWADRTIWAYRLGDDDLLTIDGLPEPATLTNGGIHAREWQTPEVVTGVLELMALHENDQHFYDYLRDNINMIVIPSLNIDGFLQTQRYPTRNFLRSDPNDPIRSPRDGRMRRKNMRNVDEILTTNTDHLKGVDLNRNNPPFWNTSPGGSSPNPASLVYHGNGPHSEGETQALEAAAQLGPADRLRIYTDVHSFTQVHLWSRNNNSSLTRQTEQVLKIFSDHHAAFPAGKWYRATPSSVLPINRGIGATDSYFTQIYQVPSWTLEVEPSGGQSFHFPLPGGGADYGGVNENGHDGFILPDSQIRRVREQLAQSFAAVYYRQAGPPAVRMARIFDPGTGAVIFEAEWDVIDNNVRSLYSQQLQALELGRDYALWLAFNKPMRWREGGLVAPFPGQPSDNLDVDASIVVTGTPMNTSDETQDWLNLPGDAPDGFMYYQDDAARLTFRLPDDMQNQELVAGGVEATLRLGATDMTDMLTDANPGTVADWKDGTWIGYEDESPIEADTGGFDTTLSVQVTDQAVPPLFLLEAGITSAWNDPAHSGEGFLLEILANGLAVMYWFTYGDDGEQDWYVSNGVIRGNRVEFARLRRVSGGEFGPGFDPAKVNREVVGSASFIWSGCDAGSMSYRIGTRHGRMQLKRITNVMGVECGIPRMGPPIREEALLSGSWYDRSHSGEGFIIEVLIDGRVVVYWFSFDPLGNRRWFFDVGEIRDGKLVFDNLRTTSGGIFGPDFSTDTIEIKPWGSLELDIDCDGGTATYASTEPGFGSGVLNVVRLTSIDQLPCP